MDKEITKKKYDVVIVGAGPAGLAAAKVLAEKNKNVLVLEKNKIIGPKVCAGGLTTKDFELGIDRKIADKFFLKIKLHTPLFEDEIKNDKPFVATVDRGKLGQYMAKEASKAGAEIRTCAMVKSIKDSFIETDQGEKIYFKYLIGADGSNSLVRKFLNLETKNRAVAFHYNVAEKFSDFELFFDANLFGAGYAWIFPHKNFTSIGCGADTRFLIDSEQLQENFKKWAKDNYPKVHLKIDNYEAWIINYDYRGHEFGNKFLAGDAAGLASGLTGEGMYFAMVSGIEIAKRILDPKYDQLKLREVIALKKKHEGILNLMKKNKVLSQVEYDILGLAQKTRLLDNLLIEKFC